MNIADDGFRDGGFRAGEHGAADDGHAYLFVDEFPQVRSYYSIDVAVADGHAVDVGERCASNGIAFFLMYVRFGQCPQVQKHNHLHLSFELGDEVFVDLRHVDIGT